MTSTVEAANSSFQKFTSGIEQDESMDKDDSPIVSNNWIRNSSHALPVVIAPRRAKNLEQRSEMQLDLFASNLAK
ncbi:hypothetical protein [Pelagicoccus sp. SDUM812002]|uniref:hypothetical protein n=1 Tax=Pelagicoccus sp. SDUM812002 TaxID=3041266 RepID=UPI0028113894|nr:hypothetical protein [Pelagicoccus sp. SDUM812002]